MTKCVEESRWKDPVKNVYRLRWRSGQDDDNDDDGCNDDANELREDEPDVLANFLADDVVVAAAGLDVSGLILMFGLMFIHA